MRLKRARVQNYRSIHDTGWFDVESGKTVLVGPNEAGKTAVLRALQTLKPPVGESLALDPLRDYPRARFTEIDSGKVDPSDAPVATGVFALDDGDRRAIAEFSPHLAKATELEITRYYDNHLKYNFGDMPMWGTYGEVEKSLGVVVAVLNKVTGEEEQEAQEALAALEKIRSGWHARTGLRWSRGTKLDEWLTAIYPLVEFTERQDRAFDIVRNYARRDEQTSQSFSALSDRIPFFVYFSQYFKVRPRIHLGRLAAQQEAGDVDREYDFGNICLLDLLGLTAKELAELGRGVPDVRTTPQGVVVEPTDEEVAEYEERLDRRSYRLNAASMTLTAAINKVWGEQRELDIQPDGQYLKVVVRNEDGARVELDQGSEGYRWLVSFYVVFEAQAKGDYANAILLLDEPGVSLHALKQKMFRSTVTAIAEQNQTIFTTHSPFMVGSDELDKVRIVEMVSRETGTLVHEDFAVGDPRSLFPLQAHLGYELGQTLFGQRRNLLVEGITDYWYLQAISEAATDAGVSLLDSHVTVVPAGDAGKVVYYATVLHAQDLRVAALFDSDTAGKTAASNETFVHLMKKKQIIMVDDVYSGPVGNPETEDLLRESLLLAARDELGIDAIAQAAAQPARPLCDLLADVGGGGFSKYKLGKGFIRWMRDHGWGDLTDGEKSAMKKLFDLANKGTK